MIKTINITLYKNNKLNKEYKKVKSIFNDNSYIFNIENVKTTINNQYFKRENDEYIFILDIIKKEAIYLLKSNNTEFIIDVEKVLLTLEKNNIILEYKISSDEETFKLIIENGDKNG